MYDTPYFKAGSREEVIAFMKANPFIVLCGSGETGRPVATHIPVLISENGDKIVLTGHLMRKQDHTSAFTHNQQVLAIFQGPHSYVSAGWYTHPETASTCNYQAVHAGGILQFLDAAELYQLLVKLTEKFENDPDSPALVQKMDPDYVEKLMKAIIGFEIVITDLGHVFKLSQNRDAQSFENIMEHLKTGTADAKFLAAEMQKQQERLFPR